MNWIKYSDAQVDAVPTGSYNAGPQTKPLTAVLIFINCSIHFSFPKSHSVKRLMNFFHISENTKSAARCQLEASVSFCRARMANHTFCINFNAFFTCINDLHSKTVENFAFPLDNRCPAMLSNCANTLNTAGGAYVPLDISHPGSCCTAARHFAARRAVQPMNAGRMP